jgi:hypothetical protein
LLALAGLLLPLSALAVDVVNLYDGQVIRGRIWSSPGEIILLKDALGSEITVKRLQVNNRRDTVETITGKRFYGSVDYIDDAKIHMTTDQGDRRLWRWFVRSITLGTPNEMRRMEANDDTMVERFTRKRTLFQAAP